MCGKTLGIFKIGLLLSCCWQGTGRVSAGSQCGQHQLRWLVMLSKYAPESPMKNSGMNRRTMKNFGGLFSILSVAGLCVASDPASGQTFPYGGIPDEKPAFPLSAAAERIYDDYPTTQPEHNELFTNFKYTPIEGLDYSNHDGTVSRRDVSKVVRANDKYYVWYTRRGTTTPPRGAKGGNETTPSYDWDLSEIWYATSGDGFTWEEQGVAVPRPPKPQAGWRSVSTPDILVWEGKYYLYYQAFLEMPGTRGDFCPVTASVSDSPDGPWEPAEHVVIENGPEGSWDQFVIHDPNPLVYKGKIYFYYKSQPGAKPKAPMWGLAIGDDPLGPFEKHPLNPITNSGHETGLFPYKGGIAALVSRNGHEHNTIQWAPDGVHFEIAAITVVMPVAPGAYSPDAFTDTKDGRGITWGLCHFRGIGEKGKKHSILARFDCDLSQDVHDPGMKHTDIFMRPEVYFQFPLSGKQKAERIKAQTEASNP